MKLEDVKVKMPKTDRGMENFFRNCEKRRKFVKDIEGHHKKHLKKAKHDLYRAAEEFKDECWDWTIVKAYYAIFHAGNAVLSKKKLMFSKDQSCLISALNFLDLVDKSLFLNLVDIYERFSDTVSIDLTFQLRKISQYDVDTWEDITEEDAESVLGVAKEFVKWSEGEIHDR